MTTNRVRLFGGAILTGGLLLGTAGLALAQDPTGPGGSGMTGGQDMMTGGQGMTGGSGIVDSLNEPSVVAISEDDNRIVALAQDPTGPGGSGMTGGQDMMTGGQGMTGGSGMMDSQTMTGAMGTMHASMTADQLRAMVHASMATSGTYDPSGR